MIAAWLSVKIQMSRFRRILLQCVTQPVGCRIARHRTLSFGDPWDRSFPLQVRGRRVDIHSGAYHVSTHGSVCVGKRVSLVSAEEESLSGVLFCRLHLGGGGNACLDAGFHPRG